MKTKALYTLVGLSLTVAVWSCGDEADEGGAGGTGGVDAAAGGQMVGGQGGGVGSGGAAGSKSGGSGGGSGGGGGAIGSGGSGGGTGGAAGAAGGSGGAVVMDAGGDANSGDANTNDAGADAMAMVNDAAVDAPPVVNNGDPGFYHFEDGLQGWAPVRGPDTAVVRLSTERVFSTGKGLSSLEYVVPAVTEAEIAAATPDATTGVRSIERGVGINTPNITYQAGTTKPIFAGKTVKIRVWFPAGYNADYTTVFVLAPDPIVPGWWKNADFLAVTPGAWNEFTFPVPTAGADIGDQFYTFGVYMKFVAPWAGGSVFVDSVQF